MDLLPILSSCNLDELKRIDVGLEGNWSPTVSVAWSRNDGSIALDHPVLEHSTFKPSLELYFDNGWIGFHCFRRIGDMNVLDDELLNRVIQKVEAMLASGS
jgi:hypothetical protein